MTFKPFKFEYNAPPTLAGSTVGRASQTGDEVILGSSERTSRSGQLFDQLTDMNATSLYLQDAIVARFRHTGVPLDLSARPEIAQALIRLYGTDTPPPVVTIGMLDKLLDAEMGAVWTEMNLGPDSDSEVNTLQMADLMLVTSAVERQLIDTGEFKYQLPIMLRQLKSDIMIHQAWQQELLQYPIMRGNLSPQDTLMTSLQQPGLVQGLVNALNNDLDRNLYDFLNTNINQYSGVYASLYGMMSQINRVERGITDVVEMFVLQPMADIARIASMLNALKGLFHKNGLQNIADSLSNFVFARMASEVGGMAFTFDRFISMAVNPIRNSVGQLGSLLNIVNRVAGSAGRAVDGLKGMSKTTACGKAPHNQGTNRYTSKPTIVPGFEPGSRMSNALQSLGEHLSWATREGDRKSQLVNDSFRKLVLRRNSDQQDRMDTMCSLQAMDSLIRLATAFVTESQTNHVDFSQTSSPQTIEAVNRILNTLQTGSGTTFTVQDGEIVVTPPDMPKPPARVENVLRAGGLKRITSDDILRVKGVTF
jgi:hypothetical protein